VRRPRHEDDAAKAASKGPLRGAPWPDGTQVLRSLVLMRVKNWDYREVRERIADGLTLGAFTDFCCDRVPKHDAALEVIFKGVEVLRGINPWRRCLGVAVLCYGLWTLRP
jgi:hypothetical protein